MFKKLEYFISVARNLSFTKAAKECFVSQTSISQQIKALESELGFALFERDKNKVSLTSAGNYFFEQCIVILAHYYGAIEQAAKIAIDSPPSLRIGYPGIYEQRALTDYMRKFYETNPDLHIEIVQGTKHSLVKMLIDGDLDLLVLLAYDLQRLDGLEIHPLSKERIVLMLGKNHPLADRSSLDPSALTDYTIILSSETDFISTNYHTKNYYAELGLEKNNVIMTNSFYSLMLMVEAGLGFAAVSSSMIDPGNSNLSFIEIEGPERHIGTVVVCLPHTVNPVVPDFINMISSLTS